jgi:hypothetical protein
VQGVYPVHQIRPKKKFLRIPHEEARANH